MLKLDEVIKASEGELINKAAEAKFTGICTDSRKLKKGELFIALVGVRFDGHEFLDMALEKGAAGLVISKDISIKTKVPVIRVFNTLKAMQDIAAAYRVKIDPKLVGVTGSSGKTTTKDMIAGILSEAGNTLKTEENFNNEIGVPLTLLKLEKKHAFAVIEMGMHAKGEIELLSFIARPDVAVITNTGLAHIERLKTEANIALAKCEILKFLKRNGTAVLNADDKHFKLAEALCKTERLTFGIDNKADIKATKITESDGGISFDLSYKGKKTKITLPLPGRHNVYNALAAAGAALALGIKTKDIVKGLSKFRPSSMRMSISTANGIKVINDAYNANPDSMKAALMVLAGIKMDDGKPPKRRIAVVGDMLELGALSKKYHDEMGEFIAGSSIDAAFYIGKFSKGSAESSMAKDPQKKAFHFWNNAKAISGLKDFLLPGDAVLVKASRGLRLEEVAAAILGGPSV